MALLRLCSLALAFAFPLLYTHAQQPSLTADQIMARFAANQDRSEAQRAHYIYVQHARVLSRSASASCSAPTSPASASPSSTLPNPTASGSPVSLGSEFKIHVLFLFTRQIVIAAENRDFEKTHVTSTILDAETPVIAKPKP